MRLPLLLLLVLLVAPLGVAQDNATNQTPANETAPNETQPESETPAAPPGPIEFTLEGREATGDFWWTLEGSSARNPTLTVAPGQKVIFHLKTIGATVHNFKVADTKPTKAFAADDGVIDFEWTAPDTPGVVDYICTIHGKGMSGKVQVGEAAPPPTGGGAGEISGETVDLGTIRDANGNVMFPQCAGTMIPAAVARGTVGGPTAADYAANNCQGTWAGAAPARPASGADYVIPISIALIGLGTVAIVWVHRRYKP